MTNDAPATNCNDSWNPNSATDTMHVIMIAREQANPFKMLSAYFITTATNSPPVAFKTTKYLRNSNTFQPELKLTKKHA